MKKLFTLTIMMVLAMHAYAVYDFSAVCETGQTLYYKYYSGFQVSLVPPGIGNWSGYSKPVGDLIIPETVEHEGITYRVTIIWNHTFKDFTELTSVEIPNSVTLIGNYAFSGCNYLTSMMVLADNPPALGNNVFAGVNKSIPVFVPFGTVSAYQAASGWNEFTNYIDCGSPITFADDNVKAICVANWDTNGDGELSYAEAAEVTDLGQVFRNNSIIISF